MARYTGSVCKLCRREGEKLFLKGERCYSDKCALARRNFAPGQHGQARKKSSAVCARPISCNTSSQSDCGLTQTRVMPYSFATANFSAVIVSGRPDSSVYSSSWETSVKDAIFPNKNRSCSAVRIVGVPPPI